jgi:WD40 repeat protein
MQLLTGHSGRVNDLTFSPDGRHLASCGNDRSVRLWDTLTGEGRVLVADEGVCDSLAFAPDGEHLLVRPRRGGLLSYNVVENRCADMLFSEAAGPHRGGLVVSSASGLVAATQRTPEGSALRFWATDGWSERGTSELRDRGVPFALAFNSEGTRLATAGGVLDLETGKWSVRSWPATGALGWSPTAPLVAGSGSMGAAWVADADTGQLSASLTLGGRHAKDLAFSPDGSSLVGVSGEGVARVWETRGWSERPGFAWDIGPLRCVAFSPDGHRAACAGHRGVIMVWDWDQ